MVKAIASETWRAVLQENEEMNGQRVSRSKTLVGECLEILTYDLFTVDCRVGHPITWLHIGVAAPATMSNVISYGGAGKIEPLDHERAAQQWALRSQPLPGIN